MRANSPLHQMRSGCPSTPADTDTVSRSRPLAGSIHEELRNRCVFVEISKGVVRQMLLLNDVEDLLER